MPFNLLLLPLLGGFIFVRYWNRTKYHAIRAEKERILLLASSFGLLFLAVAWVLKALAAWLLPCYAHPNFPCFIVWWHKFLPFGYSATSLFALLLGATVWKPLNEGILSNWFHWKKQRPKLGREWLWWQWLRRGWSENEEITRVINQDGDPLDVLLRRAETPPQRTIMVTMKSGKVYVGFVSIPSNPASQTRTIGLFPVVSGYRDEKTHQLTFTTYYADALARIDEKIDALKTERDEVLERHQIVNEGIEKAAGKKDKDISALQNEYADLEAKAQAKQQQLDELATVVNDFFIALPVGEVASVHIYRDTVQNEFFLPKPEHAPQIKVGHVQ